MKPIRIDRWRALGILLLLQLLVYGVFVHWTWTVPQLRLRTQLIDLRDQELRLRMHAQQAGRLQTLLAEVQKLEADNPGFLPEQSTELATAGLVQRLERVVEQAGGDARGCELTGRTPTTARSKEPFLRVVIQVRLRCGMTELATILDTLESGSPALFIDRLTLLSRRSLAQKQSNDAALDVSFDLYGYLRLKPEARP